jgi:C4-dicarboxylate-specific signal transduction histidine kinase
VNQPLAAIVSNVAACQGWLNRESPNLDKARRTVQWIAEDSLRAAEIVGRIRDLVKKAPPKKDWFDMNEAIRGVIVLTRGEAVKNGVSVQVQLADGLPPVKGDRVQL